MKYRNKKRKKLYTENKNKINKSKYFPRNLSQNIIRQKNLKVKRDVSYIKKGSGSDTKKFTIYNRSHQRLKKDPVFFTSFLPNNMRIVNMKLDEKMKNMKIN